MVEQLAPTQSRRPLWLLPLLLAALPGLLVLQLLPRIVDIAATPSAATALGVGELVIPLVSAGLAALAMAALGGGGAGAVATGVAAELPSLPEMVELMLKAAAAGHELDATFWVVLYLSHTTLSVTAAYYAARWWAGGDARFSARMGRGWSVLALVLSVVYMVWVGILLYFGAGAWYHLLALCAAAGAASGTVVLLTRGAARALGWAVLIAAAAVASFAVAVELSLLLEPPADMPDLSDLDLGAPGPQ
jgi:hypothetical protein